jgi:modulator of FtsH protease
MIEEWTDFFVAAAGAGAALAGLIIVAMSVNIKTILSISGMTSRAAATIGAMVLIVLMSLAALMPAQALRSFGIETICFALMASSFAAHSGYQMVRHPPRGQWAAPGCAPPSPSACWCRS